MKARTIETKRGARCRVLESGSGHPLVFFHSAGGLLAENPFLDELAGRYHVFAPELPGYGESTGEDLLEDMLDFTLHGWDVVDILGLRRPHLVGHSMGGMIAAEMAAIAPHDAGKLVLVSAAGLWMDEHPIPDLFSLLPHQFAELHRVRDKRLILLDNHASGWGVSKWLRTYLKNSKRAAGATR